MTKPSTSDKQILRFLASQEQQTSSDTARHFDTHPQSLAQRFHWLEKRGYPHRVKQITRLTPSGYKNRYWAFATTDLELTNDNARGITTDEMCGRIIGRIKGCGRGHFGSLVAPLL